MGEPTPNENTQAGAALGGDSNAGAQNVANPPAQAQPVGTSVSAPPSRVPVPVTAQPSATDTNTSSTNSPATPQKTIEVPAKKGSLGARVLSALADTLGGPKTRDVIDPKTGEKTTVKIGNNMRALHFLGDLMIGESAALGAHGPGHVGKAAELSAQAIQQRNNELFQQDQQRVMQQAQIYRNHMENMMIQQNLGYGNAKGLQEMVANDKPLYDSLVAGNAQDLTADSPNGLGHAQLMDVIKNYQQGGGKNADLIPVRAGVIPVMDPKTGQQMKDSDGVPVWENSYKIFKDSTVKLTADQAQQFSALPGVPKLAEGQEVRASRLYQLQTESNKIHSSVQVIQNSLSENGGLKGGEIDAKDPNVARALENWAGAIGRAGGDPKAALEDMSKAGKDVTPIVNAYGGVENINKVSAGITARKVTAETKARIDAESSPEALAAKQKEVIAEGEAKAKTPQGKLEIAQKNAELQRTRAETEKIRQDIAAAPYYAVDPKTGQTVQTTAEEIKKNGYTNPVKVTEGQISKDRDANATMGDVQINISRYKQALDRLPIGANRTGIAQAINEGGLSLGAHNSAIGVSIPTDWLNKLYNSSVWGELTDSEKDVVIAYYRAKGAIPAFVKAVTGSGRANKETMDIEMANMPDPTMPKDAAQKQLDAFQENVSQRSKSIPKLAGVESQAEIKKRVEEEGTQKIANAPQHGNSDTGIKVVEGHAIPADAQDLWHTFWGSLKGYQDKDGSWVDFRDMRYRNDPRFHRQ